MIFSYLFLGLIAEFIRRHHYRESVSVLSQFMPIRDELPVFKSHGGGANGGCGGSNDIPAAQLARLNIDPNEAQGGPSQANPGNEPGDDGVEEEGDIEEGAPEDQQMQRLRKGFRLSSMSVSYTHLTLPTIYSV